MSLASEQSAYARFLSLRGRTVDLVRAGVGSYPVRAVVTDFIPSDLAGGVEQGRRYAIVLAADVVASGFPLPFLVKQDRLIWGNPPKSNAITKVDDATRVNGDTLLAYELDLEGA